VIKCSAAADRVRRDRGPVGLQDHTLQEAEEHAAVTEPVRA
jgi:hypothetical protein